MPHFTHRIAIKKIADYFDFGGIVRYCFFNCLVRLGDFNTTRLARKGSFGRAFLFWQRIELRSVRYRGVRR